MINGKEACGPLFLCAKVEFLMKEHKRQVGFSMKEKGIEIGWYNGIMYPFETQHTNKLI